MPYADYKNTLAHSREYRAANPARCRERVNKWRKENLEYGSSYSAKWRKENPEYQKKWREENLEHCKNYTKEYNEKNPDYVKNWRRKNPNFIKNWTRTAYRNNPNFRMKVILGARLRQALNGVCKSTRTLELLGCSIEFLRGHLENQFQPGMSWENHSKRGWHVDHKRPCASFDLTSPEQQKDCFHFTNLQPMWATDNHKKGDRWEEPA